MLTEYPDTSLGHNDTPKCHAFWNNLENDILKTVSNGVQWNLAKCPTYI